jgi:hypothetical protein
VRACRGTGSHRVFPHTDLKCLLYGISWCGNYPTLVMSDDHIAKILRRPQGHDSREPCLVCDKRDCRATVILSSPSSHEKQFDQAADRLNVLCPACKRVFCASIYELAWLDVCEDELAKGFVGGKRAHGGVIWRSWWIGESHHHSQGAIASRSYGRKLAARLRALIPVHFGIIHR